MVSIVFTHTNELNYYPTINEFLKVLLLCRGGTGKCQMAIPDLVMLHNKASGGLTKTDRLGFDIYAGIADMKVRFLK